MHEPTNHDMMNDYIPDIMWNQIQNFIILGTKWSDLNPS